MKPLLCSLTAATFVVTACGGSSSRSGDDGGHLDVSDGGSPTKAWRAALSEIETSSIAIYSFSFEGAPPAGNRLTIGLHLTEAARACGRYDGSAPELPDREFWYLDLDLNGATAGDYVVMADRLSARTDRAATAMMVHRRDGESIERYPALSGVVSLRAAPSLDDFKAGAALVVSVDLSFSSHAVQPLACRGGQGRSGPTAPTHCACVDDEGAKSECLLEAGQDQCCFDTAAERFAWHLDVTASPCASMCRSLAGSADYCGGLAAR